MSQNSRQSPPGLTSLDSSSAVSGSSNPEKKDFGERHRKLIRIFTVAAYVMSVSAAAIVLSAYYVFIWEPNPGHNLGSKSSRLVRPADKAESPSYTYSRDSTDYSRYLAQAERYSLKSENSKNGPVASRLTQSDPTEVSHNKLSSPSMTYQPRPPESSTTPLSEDESLLFSHSSVSPTTPRSPQPTYIKRMLRYMSPPTPHINSSN